MKWFLWIFVALAAFLILVTLIGYLLPKEHTATREARFHQPPDAVWKAITNIDEMPTWRQGLKSVKRLPDVNDLPTWQEESESGTMRYETVLSKPPRKLVTRIADPKLPFGGTWTYEVTPAPDGSVLRIREDGEIYNPIFRFVARFFLGYNVTLEIYLKSLAKKFGEQPPEWK
jgi:Polyketide cyclase / dehydrase and lipid transport